MTGRFAGHNSGNASKARHLPHKSIALAYEQTRKRRRDNLTRNDKNRETGKKRAPNKSAPADPRLVALVRLLARRAAERDYARLLESLGKAQKPPVRKE
jgi:hypothetical protein